MVAEWVAVGIFCAEETSCKGFLVGVSGESGPSAGVLQRVSVRAAGLLWAGGVLARDIATCWGMAVPETEVSQKLFKGTDKDSDIVGRVWQVPMSDRFILVSC